MDKIIRRIGRLPEGQEKEFLIDIVDKRSKYLRKKDKQSLNMVIIRLDSLYIGLSETAQKISLDLVQIIMEDIRKL